MFTVDHNEKILVVENHPDVARVFAFMLESRGYRPTVAASIAEAKKRLGDEPFDLLVSDYRLDDGDALDLMRWVRSAGFGVMSICVSGYGEDAAAQCKEAGFDGFLTKPVELDALEAKVARLRKERGASADGGRSNRGE